MAYFLLPDAVRVDSNTSSNYMHRFGGPTIHRIINCNYRKIRMHCLYLFDTSDPALPKIESTGKYLPLYYPLFNNASDFAYEILNDKEIKVHLIGQKKEEKDFPYDAYPEILPEKSVNLIPLSYEEQKTIVYAYTADDYLAKEYVSAKDKEYLLSTGYPFTQIGGLQHMIQSVPEQICPNKKCEYHTYSNMHDVFAVVWNNPISGFKIWGEYGDDVQIIFQICPKCKTIYVCNRCD